MTTQQRTAIIEMPEQQIYLALNVIETIRRNNQDLARSHPDPQARGHLEEYVDKLSATHDTLCAGLASIYAGSDA